MDGRHLQNLLSRVKTVFSLDLRTLALFRMTLGLVFLHDLFLRSFDLVAHYSDLGMFPRYNALEFNEFHRFSFHLMSGAPMVMAVLFFMQALAHFFLFIGWRTKWMAFLSWFFLISLQNRNPGVLGGGDILLRLLSFWALFLPLGARFSVDQIQKCPRGHENENENEGGGEGKDFRPFFSFASAGILLQMALVYWFTVPLKSGLEWKLERSAVYYALHIDQLTTSFGRYLLQFPSLLPLATTWTLVWEVIGPLLAFSPWKNGPLRFMVVIGFLLFHCILLGWTMHLGIFPYACTVGWLLFLPSWFWDKWAGKFPVNIFSSPALASFLTFWANHLPSQTPFPSFDFNGVANGRFGKKKFSLFSQGIFILVFCYVLLWNFRELDKEKWEPHFPHRFDGLGQLLGLDQNWSLFAPHPYKDDGWFVMPGTLRNGEVIEVMQSSPAKRRKIKVTWEKPESVYGTFPNRRWGKYLRNIWFKQYQRLRAPFAEHLCYRWNSQAQGDLEKLEHLEIYYMHEETPPPGFLREKAGEVEKVLLWHHYCHSSPSPSS